MNILDTLTKSLVDVYANKLSEQERETLIECLEVLASDQKYNKFKNFFPDEGEYRRALYPKHIEFFDAGKTYTERGFIAGNRVGKSEAGCYETVCHATGLYPEWWTGLRFTRPVLIWVGGDTATTLRDIVQKKLLGEITDIGSGMLPKDTIIEYKTRRNVPDAIETIRIRHITGGTSTIVLKSYEQGRVSWQGSEVDFIWIDEEAPQEVYGEALIRLMTTKGSMIMTFTPLSGLTPVVLSFLDNSQETDVDFPKWVTICGWKDVPHIDEETKAKMLAATPPQLREARSEGKPTVGEGLVYPIDPKNVTVDDFQLPKHFQRLYGMDVGWNNCVAKDSMVLMVDGSQKPIQDIVIGEQVMAFDFETEDLVPTTVVDTFKGFATNMVRTGISEEQQIVCTDDHPFAHRGAAKNKIKMKEIKDINKRIREFQSVVLPSKWTISNGEQICSDSMARIVGYLIGDGCLTYSNRRLEFAQTIQPFIDDMRKCLLDVGCKMKSYNNNKIHFIGGGEEGNAVLEFVREIGLLGKVSLNKFIPKEFFTASESVIENLLVGLIHTDGSVEGDNVRYYTISKQLAEGVKLLCLRLGIYASISCDNRVRNANHHKTYRVTIRRPTRLALLAPKQLKSTRPERKKRADRLLSFYEKAPDQDIYCITIDHKDHAFVCNGFVVSNTAALWGAWDKDNDIIYIYTEHKQGQAEPVIHAKAIKARGEWIKGAIDPAARGRSQIDGETLYMLYRKEGLKIFPANNAVEAGIFNVWERLSTGRLKIFKSCTMLLRELSLYHRDDKGKIVKSNDHLLDCLRYLLNSEYNAWSYPQEDQKRNKVVDINNYMKACV